MARKDMIEIVRYISRELCNPAAANQLALEMIDAGNSILKFPYANPAYIPIRPLKREYRKLLVRNYMRSEEHTSDWSSDVCSSDLR